jgi:hypothetical protein
MEVWEQGRGKRRMPNAVPLRIATIPGVLGLCEKIFLHKPKTERNT